MLADPRKLVDRTKPAKKNVIADFNKAAERRVVRENYMPPDLAIMGLRARRP